MHQLKNLPILHHPNKTGQFCVKIDACNYGIGAVLYQKQYDKKSNKTDWVIVDMWSRMIPQQLRHCHSMVHEAYAIVNACQHWAFHLLKRKLKISTDNRPVATLFTPEAHDIDPITKRQLLRLRVKLNMFAFDSHHVPHDDLRSTSMLHLNRSELDWRR